MTLLSTPPRKDYVEDGVTLVHTIPFQFDDPSEIVCTRIPLGVPESAPLIQGAAYTVTGGAGGTGTVTKTSGGTAGVVFRVKRATQQTQSSKFDSGGAFPASSVEKAFDRDMKVAQETAVGNQLIRIDVDANTADILANSSGLAEEVLDRTAGDASLLSLIQNLPSVAAHISDTVYLTPEMFGADPTGVADSYAAFQALFAALGGTRLASLKMKPGAIYNINQKVMAGNGIVDLKIQSAIGLKIEGNGAVINILGNFDRAVSTTRQLSFIFADCVGLNLSNYEINGHVDQMTNTSNAVEAFSYGQLFQGCTDVLAVNVNVHHMATDNWSFQGGTSFGGVRKACRRVVLINCQGQYAARLAISLIQVRGFYGLVCNFGMSARYTGTYGFGGQIGHAPKGSLDIEPDFNTATAAPNTMDVNTGRIVFEHCDFIGSTGLIWSAALPASIDGLTFRDCTGVFGSATTAAAVILGVPGVLLDNCNLDLGDGYFQFCHSADPTTYGKIIGGSIKGTYMLMQSQFNTARSVCRDVDFINTCIAPYGHSPAATPPILCSNSGMAFENCRLYVPKEAFVTGGTGDSMLVAGLPGVRRVRDFRFETNLPANQYGAVTAHYHVNDLGGTSVGELSNIHFVGSAPGTADTFRPNVSSTFDTNNKFNRTPGHSGAIGKRALTDAAATHVHSIDPGYAELAAPLTANRVLALSATDAVRGAELKVTRTAASTGASTYNVGGLKALATGQWCTVRHNGTAWDLLAFGSL